MRLTSRAAGHAGGFEAQLGASAVGAAAAVWGGRPGPPPDAALLLVLLLLLHPVRQQAQLQGVASPGGLGRVLARAWLGDHNPHCWCCLRCGCCRRHWCHWCGWGGEDVGMGGRCLQHSVQGHRQLIAQGLVAREGGSGSRAAHHNLHALLLRLGGLAQPQLVELQVEMVLLLLLLLLPVDGREQHVDAAAGVGEEGGQRGGCRGPNSAGAATGDAGRRPRRPC